MLLALEPPDGGGSDGCARWLRRQTVAMELVAALHRSRGVGPGTNDGLRAQTTASSGMRPAPLEEVSEPQGKLV